MSIHRILLAYDGGDPAVRALEMTAQLAHAFAATVTVVSVARSDRLGEPDGWEDAESHARQLVEARARLRELGVEPKLAEPAGDPALVIEEVAAAGHYDTVVLGSRDLSPIDRITSPSVSTHVASYAAATVIVAR
jgi:nucleotide-binding universal stress UspA family protein